MPGVVASEPSGAPTRSTTPTAPAPSAEVEALLGGGGGLTPVDLADATALGVGSLEEVLGVPGEAVGDRGHRGHASVDVVGVGGALGSSRS